MRKLLLALALVAGLVPVAAGPASAQTTSWASGQILMTVHTHSAGVLLFPVDRLSYAAQTGETFAYSSRLCSGNAPFNDLGLNFIPDYPGVDDDDGIAPVRHGISGTVTSSSGDQGTVQGTLRTVLCVPGPSPNGQVESGHVIVSHFVAAFQRVSQNALVISGGFQISPTESTGTFRDMVGGGRMEGRFTCLSAPTCAERGEFTDFVGHRGDPSLGPGLLQPGLVGSFFDPTVETAPVG
jgi:hypothetical protein